MDGPWPSSSEGEKMRLDRIQAIADVANRYLAMNVGDAARADTPRRNSRQRIWTADILCKTEFGHLLCGSMKIDDAGQIVSVPSKDELIANVRRMKQKLAEA